MRNTYGPIEDPEFLLVAWFKAMHHEGSTPQWRGVLYKMRQLGLEPNLKRWHAIVEAYGLDKWRKQHAQANNYVKESSSAYLTSIQESLDRLKGKRS